MTESSSARPHTGPRVAVLVVGVVVVAFALIDRWLTVRRGFSAPVGTVPFLVFGGLLVAAGLFGRKVVPAYRGTATNP